MMTEKGQVTIPAAIREAAGIRPGMRVEVIAEAGKAIVRLADPASVRARRGSEMRKRIAAFRAKHPPIETGLSTDEIMASMREPLP